MKALLVACAVGLAAGCGASSASVRPDRADDEARRARVEALQERNREQAGRLRELEARLALAQAEVEDLRGRSVCDEGPPRESVRIGEESGGDGPAPAAESSGGRPGPDGNANRPVLRLYGQRHADTQEVEPVAEVPEGLPSRLPVAPVPDEGVGAYDEGDAPEPSPAAAASPEPADPAVRAYRKALTAVRDRRFDRADGLFARFLERYGSHPYADHARYWRAEVLYALRRYEPALAAFTRVARSHPSADRVAEALFKIGLCHKHLGDRDRARRIFERVKREFPGSVAARLASQEDAS